jgi:bifunctional non-homologous end joining protein LigD
VSALTKSQLSKLPGARASAMPREVEPMKAVLVDEPFDRAGWLFEDKYDGIRTMCYIKSGKVTLYSRNQKEMTARYPEMRDMPKWIDAKEAVLDGEIIVVNKAGTASFQDLQARFGVTDLDVIKRLTKTQKVVLYVFDMIYVDGYSLMGCRLIDRKEALSKIVKKRAAFQVAPHNFKDGIKRFRAAEKKKLEGIVAKNSESTYEQKRSNEWLKIKTTQRQEAVIVGYTKPEGSREHFGALHLGLYDGKRLVSVGKVGTGFNHKLLKELFDKMRPLRTDHPPFDDTPRELRRADVQWLKPKLVCEVKFSERTGEGSFRHPSFVGLRYDKKPIDCKYEAQQDASKEIKSAERKAKRSGSRNL